MRVDRATVGEPQKFRGKQRRSSSFATLQDHGLLQAWKDFSSTCMLPVVRGGGSHVQNLGDVSQAGCRAWLLHCGSERCSKGSKLRHRVTELQLQAPSEAPLPCSGAPTKAKLGWSNRCVSHGHWAVQHPATSEGGAFIRCCRLHMVELSFDREEQRALRCCKARLPRRHTFCSRATAKGAGCVD